MYIVSYDISIDRIRNKIAKTLLNYGKRVQYSVFECNITKIQYKELYQKLAFLVSQDKMGSIRFYSVCEKCCKQTVVLGVQPDRPEDEDVLII